MLLGAAALCAQQREALPLVTQTMRGGGSTGGDGCQVCIGLTCDATGNFMLVGTNGGGLYRTWT